jgi:hypothetical protein
VCLPRPRGEDKDKDEKEKRKGEEGERKEREKRGEFFLKKSVGRAISTFYDINRIGEAVLPNVFQNGSNSTKEATPSEEPEPEPFSEEPEPCQTGPEPTTYVSLPFRFILLWP